MLSQQTVTTSFWVRLSLIMFSDVWNEGESTKLSKITVTVFVLFSCKKQNKPVQFIQQLTSKLNSGLHSMDKDKWQQTVKAIKQWNRRVCSCLQHCKHPGFCSAAELLCRWKTEKLILSVRIIWTSLIRIVKDCLELKPDAAGRKPSAESSCQNS